MFSFIFFFGVLRDLYFERDRIVVHAFKRRVLLSSRRMNGPSHDGIPAVVHVWLGGWGGGAKGGGSRGRGEHFCVFLFLSRWILCISVLHLLT